MAMDTNNAMVSTSTIIHFLPHFTPLIYNPSSDVDECSRPGVCHENAVCTNTPGKYFCQCKEGFTGEKRGQRSRITELFEVTE